MKTCYTCKESKHESEYYSDYRTKNKLNGRCKVCIREYQKKNYLRYRPNMRKMISDRAKNGTWFKRTKKKCPGCKKTLDIDNFYKAVSTYDGHNPYCKPCAREKTKTSGFVMSGKHKEYNAMKRFNIKLEIINKLGGRCAVCGNSNLFHLQFDHVNNDGNQDRVEKGGSSSFSTKQMKAILSGKHKYELQILCANCNHEKKMRRHKYFSKLAIKYMERDNHSS